MAIPYRQNSYPLLLVIVRSPRTQVRKIITTITICLNNTLTLGLERVRHFVYLLNHLFDLLHLGFGSSSHQHLACKHLDVLKYPFHQTLHFLPVQYCPERFLVSMLPLVVIPPNNSLEYFLEPSSSITLEIPPVLPVPSRHWQCLVWVFD